LSTTLQIPSYSQESRLSLSEFRKDALLDMLQMTVCFLGAVAAVYYAPKIANMLYFVVMLVLFWRSKKDYFWFAFFFILVNTPGHMFVETSATATRRLPLYSVLPGVSFSVFDLFILLSVAKIYYLKKGQGKKFLLTKSAKFILFYLLLVTFPMTFIIGFEGSGASFFNNFRPYFYYTLVFSFFMLIDKTEDIYRMGYLMFPFLVFTIFDQLFLLTTGKLFISIINPDTIRYIVKNTVTGGARAYFSGFLMLFYGFLFGLQLRMNRKYEILPGLGYLFIILPFTAFVLSATRAYLMMPLLTLFGFMLYSKKAAPDLIKLSLATLVFAVIFFSLDLISWETFVKGIWPRFEAFFNVIFGSGKQDLQEFDTVGSRLDTDLPDLLEGISHSPILGIGFSGLFRRYINDDLGFLNSILVFGFVGFLFILNFFVFFLKSVNKWARKKYADQDNKVILKSVIMVFFGILIGYATTYDYFTVMHTYRIYFVSLILGSAEVAAHNIKQNKIKREREREHFF
jgi:hypothetical protein